MASTKMDTFEKQVEQLISSGRRYRVTAFTSSHKIVGTAFVASEDHEPSWRTSDFLRSLTNEHLTLGDAEIRDIATGTIVDRPDYVMLSLRSVEVMYAEEAE